MATTLSYSVSDFVPFTIIKSSDVNSRFSDIKSRLNWAGGTDATTGLGDDNIQSNAASGGGLTRATKLKLGTASHVLINDGTGAMSSEATLATSRGGLGANLTPSGTDANKVVRVNGTGTGFELGSSSGGANLVDMLIQKLAQERIGGKTDTIDYTFGESGKAKLEQRFFNATLLEQYSSGASSVSLVWNALAVRDADQNLDATTSWTAVGDGGSLTTSATAKVGSASLSFAKAGAGTEAGIRFDRGSQNFAVNANYRVWFWVNLSTTTNITDIYLKMYADTTSNYRKWTKTTNYAGTAIASGWNLMFVDISDTTGSSTGGTGFVSTQLSRYIEIGVDGTSGATATILVDALYFSYGAPLNIGIIGSELTLFNNSTKNNIVIDAANTRADGPLTLAATVANTYVGGLSGSTRGRVQRTTLAADGNNVIQFDNDATFGGSLTTEQEIRIGTVWRESLGGSYQAFVDVIPVQMYTVSAVGGSTLGVVDPANDSANLVSGDSIHIFRPQQIDGKKTYKLIATRSMTGNSSASGGTTTLTVVTTDVAVGDIVCKKHLSDVKLSTVATSANDSYTALTAGTEPNGTILLGDGIYYPKPENVAGHFFVGAETNTEAVRNRKGSIANLTVTGSPSLQASFLSGRYAGNNWSGSNYLSTSTGVSAFDGAGETVELSMWVYITAGFTGANRSIWSLNDGVGDRLAFGMAAASNTFFINENGSPAACGSFSLNTWTHIFVTSNNSSHQTVYVNGALTYDKGSAPSTPASTTFYIGIDYSGAAGAGTGTSVADCIIWVGGTTMSASQVNQIYNRGLFIPVGDNAINLRYNYSLATGTGQRDSLRAVMTRTTTAVRPGIAKLGVIRSA